MADYTKYIGIEFQDNGRGPKCDCWGLVHLVLAEQFGISLPSMHTEYDKSIDYRRIPKLVARERSKWTLVDDPKEGDVVLLRMQGYPLHVGVYLTGHRMLHILKGTNACIESLRSPVWKPRIEGYYRYAG